MEIDKAVILKWKCLNIMPLAHALLHSFLYYFFGRIECVLLCVTNFEEGESILARDTIRRKTERERERETGKRKEIDRE